MKILERWVLKRYFNAITEDDVLKIVKGKDGKLNLVVAGALLPESDYKAIRAEARSFKNSLLWQHLVADVTFEGNRSIYQSKTYEDTYFGKALIFAAKVFDKKIELLARDDKDMVV